jgi:hypothetical protein
LIGTNIITVGGNSWSNSGTKCIGEDNRRGGKKKRVLKVNDTRRDVKVISCNASNHIKNMKS